MHALNALGKPLTTIDDDDDDDDGGYGSAALALIPQHS